VCVCVCVCVTSIGPKLLGQSTLDPWTEYLVVPSLFLET
jgi:hypothetical protein